MPFVIGICDDSLEQVELLLKYLGSYTGLEGFETVHSTQPDAFLEQLNRKKPDIVLLDIDMGETNGIQLGEKIKVLYPDTVIIYITAHEEYALNAFAVRAFHYLLKPLKKEHFFLVMDEALAYISKKSPAEPAKTFSIQVKGEFICVPHSDICCFEKIGRRIRIHTSEREIYYYGNLQELPDMLRNDTFLQCHQGYIVNVDKIRSFREKTLFLEKGLAIPVSRSYMEQVRDSLARMLFAGREAK